MGAFADRGVVQLLTKKMQLCKEEESQRASTRNASCRKKVRSSRRKAAKARRAVTAGTVSETSPLAVTTTVPSSRREVGSEMSHDKLGKAWQPLSSPRLEDRNERVLPSDPGPGANGAHHKSLVVRGCDEPPTPTFTLDSNATSATPVPPGLERGKREGFDGCAGTAVFEDVAGGCLERQETAAITRDGTSGDDVKRRVAFPAAGGIFDGMAARGEAGTSSLLQVVCKDRPPSSCTIGVGDGPLGTRARSDRDEDALCEQPDTSDEGPTAAVRSPPKEDFAHVFSAQSHRRAAGSRSSSPASTAESTGAKIAVAGTTDPSSYVAVERDQSLALAEASTAAATPSPTTGVLAESHTSEAEDGSLNSLLSTFEQQVERGAELARRFEEAAKPRSLALEEDVKAGERDDGKAESGQTNILSTMSPSSVGSEDKQFAESSKIATDIAETDQSEVPEPVRIGATPGEADARSDREPERTAKTSNPEEGLLCLSGAAEQLSTGRGDSTFNRSLAALRERSPSSESNTTLGEDNEDYEFTFDDEEMVVGQKSVQFADESRWSTHEVRACFERHELGDLFYTTAELDSMSEEAEAEEALERSSSRLSRGEKRSEGDTAAVGGGLSCFGGNQAPQGRTSSSGAEETVAFEKVSFHDEDSDYDF